ncbi:DUF4148 domain-containing protein [Variovorax saccharolyticus]|uniref:DUF4148 domain-containing protein n=1 Tax=Variovorax saccharolyticus TaxID=3053516 RepID=UPI0025755E74|nr:DUF4148 domain-containing protein [Variovorax sp. J31P216]MDM0029522.1 DUF4148 domain-containing protein [Variovorax sp. J31P216]
MKAIARFTLSIPSALIAMLAIGAAQAETYEGVVTLDSHRERSGVLAEAVAAAHTPEQNVVPGSRGPLPFRPMVPRTQVQSEAIQAAKAPDQNVVPGSRVNSRVISTMPVSRVAGGEAAGR